MFFHSKNFRRINNKYLPLLLICIVFACQQQQINPPIAREKFVPIYTDYIVAADTTENEDVGAVLDSLLVVHQLQRADFRANLQFYADHPQKWQEFLDAVIDRLNQRMQAFDEEEFKKNLKPPSIHENAVRPNAIPRN